MDPPDATTTFLGASPFTDYLRELSSQDIADWASTTIASQNRLSSPIILTITSCLDDPIADDCLADDRLIILPNGSAPITFAEWSPNDPLALSRLP